MPSAPPAPSMASPAPGDDGLELERIAVRAESIPMFCTDSVNLRPAHSAFMILSGSRIRQKTVLSTVR